MTSVRTAFALVLIATAGFAGITHAEGDYYEGAQKNTITRQPRQPVGPDYTGSVSHASPMYDHLLDEKAIDSGDYYEGVQRPS